MRGNLRQRLGNRYEDGRIVKPWKRYSPAEFCFRHLVKHRFQVAVIADDELFELRHAGQILAVWKDELLPPDDGEKSPLRQMIMVKPFADGLVFQRSLMPFQRPPMFRISPRLMFDEVMKEVIHKRVSLLHLGVHQGVRSHQFLNHFLIIRLLFQAGV